MKATRTPIPFPEACAYTCTRCGIRKTYGGSRTGPRPTTCVDCRDVLTYVDIEHGTIAGRAAHARLREPMCGPCRDAYNASREAYTASRSERKVSA